MLQRSLGDDAPSEQTADLSEERFREREALIAWCVEGIELACHIAGAEPSWSRPPLS